MLFAGWRLSVVETLLLGFQRTCEQMRRSAVKPRNSFLTIGNRAKITMTLVRLRMLLHKPAASQFGSILTLPLVNASSAALS